MSNRKRPASLTDFTQPPTCIQKKSPPNKKKKDEAKDIITKFLSSSQVTMSKPRERSLNRTQPSAYNASSSNGSPVVCVTSHREESMLCSTQGCGLWTLMNIPVSYPKDFAKSKNFLCGLCSGSSFSKMGTAIADLQKEIYHLKSKLGEIEQKTETKIGEIEQKTESLASEQAEIKNKEPGVVDFSAALQSNLKKKGDCAAILITEIHAEQKRQGAKQKNLIVSGTRPSKEKSDVILFKELTTAMGVNKEVKPKEIKRVGIVNEGTGQQLLLVVFEDIEERNLVLKGAKFLKQCEDFNQVYVNPDLTRAEMNEQYNLRQALKKLRSERTEEIHFIRGSEIISHKRKVEMQSEKDQSK